MGSKLNLKQELITFIYFIMITLLFLIVEYFGGIRILIITGFSLILWRLIQIENK